MAIWLIEFYRRTHLEFRMSSFSFYLYIRQAPLGPEHTQTGPRRWRGPVLGSAPCPGDSRAATQLSTLPHGAAHPLGRAVADPFGAAASWLWAITFVLPISSNKVREAADSRLIMICSPAVYSQFRTGAQPVPTRRGRIGTKDVKRAGQPSDPFPLKSLISAGKNGGRGWD